MKGKGFSDSVGTKKCMVLRGLEGGCVWVAKRFDAGFIGVYKRLYISECALKRGLNERLCMRRGPCA